MDEGGCKCQENGIIWVTMVGSLGREASIKVVVKREDVGVY